MDLPEPSTITGAPLPRVDARAKVTGQAAYAAEAPAGDDVVHAVLLTSTIARGRITRMDTATADSMPGVLAIITPFNAERLPGAPKPQGEVGEGGAKGSGRGGGSQGGSSGGGGPTGAGASEQAGSQQSSQRIPSLLQDERVHYNGQPIGVVVADTLERARDAAGRVRVEYEREEPELDFATGPRAPDEKVAPTAGDDRATSRGDIEAGLAAADERVELTYTTPLENHNPMEMHATIARWDDDQLTLYDSTQAVFGVRKTIAATFSVSPEKVRVISPFTGGGFGSKGGAWSHQGLAAMAARRVKRPVKLMLTRQQMFGPVGGRPMTSQKLAIGARRDGRLTALRHDAVANTSKLEDWLEPSAVAARMLYESESNVTSHALVRLNLGSPTFMRAPGEASGMFALESAIDELAIALDMDPLALRLANYAERDPSSGSPWSSKGLRDCYLRAAGRFGWERRTHAPRSMRDGDTLIGWGMATATRTSTLVEASATVCVRADGSALVRSGSQEIGGGTATVLSQIAADALGVPVERVTVEIGDTELPKAPASVGSKTAASVGTAVHEAALAARRSLLRIARTDPASPLHGAAEIRVHDGRMMAVADPARGERYADLIARHGGFPVEGQATTKAGPESEQYSMHNFGATFVEVRVDPDLGEVSVSRAVGVYDVGRVLNHRTASAQAIGSIVWAIGMALQERTLVDPQTGRYVNADLAEYHVPVHADIGSIDVSFVEPVDPFVNPIGVKGAGEVAMTGVAAAIANAVHHATGVRVRDLPITLDKLL